MLCIYTFLLCSRAFCTSSFDTAASHLAAANGVPSMIPTGMITREARIQTIQTGIRWWKLLFNTVLDGQGRHSTAFGIFTVGFQLPSAPLKIETSPVGSSMSGSNGSVCLFAIQCSLFRSHQKIGCHWQTNSRRVVWSFSRVLPQTNDVSVEAIYFHSGIKW